jgi:hypothetical protein
VPQGIVGETTMKMMHQEEGIHRKYVLQKEIFKEKLRCDTLDIWNRNLVNDQDLCAIQKKNKKITIC